MQPAPINTGVGRSHGRLPGSFSPLPGPASADHAQAHALAHNQQLQTQPSGPTQLPPLRIDSPTDSEGSSSAIAVPKTRQASGISPATPIYQQFASHANSSNVSLNQNYARNGGSRVVTPGGLASPVIKNSSRKYAATQGLFEPTLPSASMSNLSHAGVIHGGPPVANPSVTLTTSQIAAQAAVASHQNAFHARQRSQTAPHPGENSDGARRGSASKGPLNPPTLSLTEASVPRDSGFSPLGVQERHPVVSHSPAATAAANVVFPRSGHNSPREPSISPQPFPTLPQAPVAAASAAEKPLSKSEKAKAKLFSRPGKIITSKSDIKEKALPSPGKIGTALSALQRGNFSTNSLVDPGAQSMYNMSNSSSATIRPVDIVGSVEEKTKEKEKKHHFLSRQKQKLKDEYHLPLSSAASNSRPTDPNAPSSLYNFSVPPSPGPSSTGFPKSKKDKRHMERSESRLDNDSTTHVASDWPGSNSLPSLSQQSSLLSDALDISGKVGSNAVSMDDAWPYLKAKLLVIFQGEDLRLPVEDINRAVQMHVQWCIHKRSPNIMLEDLRDLLVLGFSTLDRTLRKTPEERFIPMLVELWLFTFTSILPYMQAAFLPLDLEVSGCGSIMTAEQSRDFWGGVVTQPRSSADFSERVMPAATVLDVRRLVLTAYRDIVILPRYDTLKTIFSRLSLEFLPSAFASMALASPPLDQSLSTSPAESFFSLARPGTAMSVDPSVGSYNSTSTTLLGEGSAGGRSRAVSNVSLGSRGSDGAIRPFTPSGVQVLSSVREQNVEDSKQVTDMVGRMLQCMSVLAGLGGMGSDADDEGNKKMVELCKMLKLNWLGRGRTGRNRMGIVGGRVRREETREELRVN